MPAALHYKTLLSDSCVYGKIRDFIKNHITLVGCPKLDEGDYTEKLTAIISQIFLKENTSTLTFLSGGINWIQWKK